MDSYFGTEGVLLLNVFIVYVEVNGCLFLAVAVMEEAVEGGVRLGLQGIDIAVSFILPY